jgi:hypothetical protein
MRAVRPSLSGTLMALFSPKPLNKTCTLTTSGSPLGGPRKVSEYAEYHSFHLPYLLNPGGGVKGGIIFFFGFFFFSPVFGIAFLSFSFLSSLAGSSTAHAFLSSAATFSFRSVYTPVTWRNLPNEI